MRFAKYTRELPSPPNEFGHDALVNPYHMLGNDRWGNCFWAGAAHETYLWTAAAGKRARITTQDTLDDYAAGVPGFDTTNPNSDVGTDMQAGASYRRTLGIRDATNSRHKIGAYTAIQAGNVAEHKLAVWRFGVVGLGIQVGDSQQDQFNHGVAWDGLTGGNVGGHYVPLVAYRDEVFWCVTWGKLQALTPRFLQTHNDESIAYFSTDMLNGGKSIDGLDQAALLDDFNQLTKG